MASDEAVHRKKWLLLLLGGIAAFIATLDASIVNVALPTLARSFGVGVADVAWVVLSYTLAITATLLLVGRLAARHGYRLVYIGGFGLFASGSLLCAGAWSLGSIVVARAVQGLGASALMATGPALVTRAFPARERGKAMGLVGTSVGVGLMTGPPLGGFIVAHLGWPWIFLINVPLGIAGAVWASRLLRILEPDDPSARIDARSAALQAVAVIGALVVLNRLEAGWPFPVLVGVSSVAGLALAAFLRRELRSPTPLIGLGIFRNRPFALAVGSMTITFVATSAAMVLVPFLLEDLLRQTPDVVGLVLAVIPACTLVSAPISGRISDAIGVRGLTTGGLAVFALGLLSLATLGADSGPWEVALRLVPVGVGLGTFQAPNSSAMMGSVPRSSVGIASSLLAVGRNVGIAAGVAVATAAFAHRQAIEEAARPPAEAFVAAFSWTLIAFAVVAAAAVAVSVLRPNRISAG